MTDPRPSRPTHPVVSAEPLQDEGAVEAPVLFFDEVPATGVAPGVHRLMLCVHVQDVDATGALVTRRKVVAHLRASPHAFERLRGAIDAMAAMTARPEGPAN